MLPHPVLSELMQVLLDLQNMLIVAIVFNAQVLSIWAKGCILMSVCVFYLT